MLSPLFERRALNLHRRGALFLWFDEQIHAANRNRFYAICSKELIYAVEV
jgi:hypothetical protein